MIRKKLKNHPQTDILRYVKDIPHRLRCCLLVGIIILELRVQQRDTRRPQYYYLLNNLKVFQPQGAGSLTYGILRNYSRDTKKVLTTSNLNLFVGC